MGREVEEFVLDADSENPIDLSQPTNLQPTKDVEHSILEPMDIKPLRLPQSQIDKMYAEYDEVCLNDFKDMYHMSEEERKATLRFYEAFKGVRKMKIKHRRLDSYIEAYRISMKCLREVAEGNLIYDPDVFVQKVLKGSIKVSGLKIPKYLGKGKKDINWDIVTEYILNEDLDPKDLIKKSNESFWEEVTDDDVKDFENLEGCSLEEYMDSIETLSEEEMEKIDLDEDEVEGRNIVVPLKKKNQRKLLKGNRSLVMGINDSRKAQRARDRISSAWAYELTASSFDEIRAMDDEREKLNKVPKFKGNIFHGGDVDKYLATLEQFERDHVKVVIRNRAYTQDEADELELKELLERNGLNIRKFYSYKEDEKKMRQAKKRDEKKIKRLKRSLAEAKKRYEERDSGGGVNTKKKKKKKSKKSDNKIGRSAGYDSFEDYAKQMESWED